MRIRNAILLTMTLLPCAANAGEEAAIHALVKNRGGLVVHYDCGDGKLTAAPGPAIPGLQIIWSIRNE